MFVLPSLDGAFNANVRKTLGKLLLGDRMTEIADLEAVIKSRLARHLARWQICRFGIEQNSRDVVH